MSAEHEGQTKGFLTCVGASRQASWRRWPIEKNPIAYPGSHVYGLIKPACGQQACDKTEAEKAMGGGLGLLAKGLGFQEEATAWARAERWGI